MSQFETSNSENLQDTVSSHLDDFLQGLIPEHNSLMWHAERSIVVDLTQSTFDHFRTLADEAKFSEISAILKLISNLNDGTAICYFGKSKRLITPQVFNYIKSLIDNQDKITKLIADVNLYKQEYLDLYNLRRDIELEFKNQFTNYDAHSQERDYIEKVLQTDEQYQKYIESEKSKKNEKSLLEEELFELLDFEYLVDEVSNLYGTEYKKFAIALNDCDEVKTKRFNYLNKDDFYIKISQDGLICKPFSDTSNQHPSLTRILDQNEVVSLPLDSASDFQLDVQVTTVETRFGDVAYLKLPKDSKISHVGIVDARIVNYFNGLHDSKTDSKPFVSTFEHNKVQYILSITKTDSKLYKGFKIELTNTKTKQSQSVELFPQTLIAR